MRQKKDMESWKAISRRNIGFSFLVLFAILLLWVVISKPFVAHRLATKAYTYYEIAQLKYPNSRIEEKEIRPTTKITMETRYEYITEDDVDTVRDYMEGTLPGFEQLFGSRVINEPTFRNSFCADETAFRVIFQYLEKGHPCIEVKIFPSENSNTTIWYSEIWTSMGFPAWLRRW